MHDTEPKPLKIAREITPINIEEELKSSYLDYAMSVIVGRALPDVRDGLKPVHRRALFAMHELKNDWNKPYKKSARIVGDVIGKYHPHGDTAVYDTLVRMAQPFSMRYVLIDGQGNFGSIDGDAPAAMRYTEIRLSRLAHFMLLDLDKETVDFVPNYDEAEMMPQVLPTRLPNLLLNGSSGIAVGMATNIPPHNLNEVVDACIALIKNPLLDLTELMTYLSGPDFPTAGMIHGRDGIIEAYKTGRGRIYLRAKTVTEQDKQGRDLIVVNELPYQVNKARLIEKIAELVRDKRLEGISGLRDESDQRGLRVVIEIQRGESPEVILNNLLSHTQLEIVFGINMVALDNRQPRLMNLRGLLGSFLQHRRDVVTRRTLYELKKARHRLHILEGLGVALANIDDIITLIKTAKTPAAAKEKLLEQTWPLGVFSSFLKKVANNPHIRPHGLSLAYGLQDSGYCLSPIQVQAILDLRLHRLTALEANKIREEYTKLIEWITELLTILSDPKQLNQVIIDELLELKEQFGDQRRTEIIDIRQHFSEGDLITEENRVVTISQAGYLKSQSLSGYQAQRRGGRGKAATKMKEQDFVKQILIANTHDTILCFSTQGKVYWLKVYEVPVGTRVFGGRPIVNLLPLIESEQITAILPVQDFMSSQFIMMVTAAGIIKKLPLSEFSQSRSKGKIALGLNPGDQLIGVVITDGSQEIMLLTDAGKAIRFHEHEVRAMGRLAHGVRGIHLNTDQSVIALMIVVPHMQLLTATVHGYGQRTRIEDYRTTSRAGKGVIAIRVNERNGKVVSAQRVFDGDEILLISDKGTLVRTRVNEISQMGRHTQGVRLIHLLEGESLVGMERISAELLEEETEKKD